MSGYDISYVFREEYDSLPSSEQWRAHRTLPAVDFLKGWTARYARLVEMLVPNAINGPTTGTFHTRAKDRLTGERLAHETGPLEEWHPDTQDLINGSEDDQARQRDQARWLHVAVSWIVPVAVVVLVVNSFVFCRTSIIVSFDMGGLIRLTRAPVW